jgi:hypothetical protein
MSLKNLIKNYIIYGKIINNLDNKSRINLSLSCKEINTCMNKEGYFNNLYFKCDDLHEYIKTLELMDKHKRYLKILIVHKQNYVFYYLPEDNKYDVIFEYCYIPLDKYLHPDNINKYKYHNCRSDWGGFNYP